MPTLSKNHSLTSWSDALDAKIKFSRMTYSARVAGVDHAELLGCDEAAAVLLLEQIIRLADNRPIEWSTTWLKPGQSIVSDAVSTRLGVQRFPWSVRFRRCCVHLALGCVRLVKVVARCIQNKAKMGVEMDNKSRNRGAERTQRGRRAGGRRRRCPISGFPNSPRRSNCSPPRPRAVKVSSTRAHHNGTTRRRHNVVAARDEREHLLRALHALFGIGGLRARPAQDVAQIFLKDRRILEVWRAGNHIIGRHHRGRTRTETINRLAGDVSTPRQWRRMRLVLRAIDRLKHATAQHMVPVYACLLITQAGCLIVAIKKHRAGRIGAPVEEPVEIGAVVFTLHNGIVDRGTGDVDPPHHIGIDGGQLIKIDARYARADPSSSTAAYCARSAYASSASRYPSCDHIKNATSGHEQKHAHHNEHPRYDYARTGSTGCSGSLRGAGALHTRPLSLCAFSCKVRRRPNMRRRVGTAPRAST